MGHYASEMGYGSDDDWQRRIQKIREAGFELSLYEARPWVCPRCYALVQTEQTLLHLATHTPLPAGDLPYDDQLKRTPAPDPANVLERVRTLFVLWSEDLSAGRCPSCGMMPETDCDHGEGYHHAYSDLRNALYLDEMPTRS